ncbi:hypothetical protein AURDEDRAFT_164354 [Auricularia subglabra TFB-10046 SS5]|nr:hypothetical protein AURDEDRAFT_164354 [Auricularia subglabra TFB-10046 SS5]
MPYIGAAASRTLIGIFLEVLLTGAFLVVATSCAWSLYSRWRAGSGRSMYYLVATFVTLTLLIVVRTAVDLERTIHSFSYPSDTGAIDLGAPASVESLMTNTLLVLITVVADVFLIYRVFVVWESNWSIIIIPVLLCAGEAGGGTFTIYALAAAGATVTLPSGLRIMRGFTIFLYFTLAANLLCTLLIAGRIWWIRRATKDVQGPAHDPVSLFVTLVVESAAIYSAVLIPEIVCIAYSSPTRYVFINMIGPIVGIVFSYIINRASRNSRSYDVSRLPIGIALQFSHPSGTSAPRHVASTGGSESDATRIHVSWDAEGVRKDAKRFSIPQRPARMY